MTFQIFKWSNNKYKPDFDDENFYIRNGLVIKLGRFGIQFVFNKLHITLSVFSDKTMYEFSLMFKKKPMIFKENVVFEKVLW